MKRIILLLVLLPFCMCGQVRFITPIEGVYGKDFIISSYYDHGQGQLLHDYKCRERVHNGHTGTDFEIQSFYAMDSGVNVLAAAGGVVIYAKDGEFDRETDWKSDYGLANAIGILHADSTITIYGHLKKGSVLVKPEDSVKQGQVVALVGSSGRSKGPHLHFEVRKNKYPTDPFSGRCSDIIGYWLEPLPYDTTFRLWRHGLSRYIPSETQIWTDVVRIDTFYLSDTVICLWGTMLNMLKKDRWRVEWRSPDNYVQASYTHPKLEEDMWYYNFWPSMELPVNGPFGRWSVRLYRNKELVVEKGFYVVKEVRSRKVGN